MILLYVMPIYVSHFQESFPCVKIKLVMNSKTHTQRHDQDVPDIK